MEKRDSEFKITIKIDNLIRNYCYNFLSYLYLNAGWKRVIFESSKENYIDSCIKGKKIRILIANNGTIILTCYCFTDMLQSIEYLLSQFQYGRMEYYLVADEKVSIKIFGNFSKRDEQEIGSEENVRSEEIRSEDVTSERLGREEIGREEDVRREDIRSEEKFYDIADEEKDESEEDTIQYIFSFLNFADYF